MLRFLLCLAASFGVVASGYCVGYSDASADAIQIAAKLRAEARKPASMLGIRQCGSTVMAVMSRGDGSLILMTEPARDAEKINGIAHTLPDGRAAVAVLPCPDSSTST